MTKGNKDVSAAHNVLLVEDNTSDVRLVQEVFKDSIIPCTLYVARSGEQALQMLRREGAYAEVPVPDLVLMDLNLPMISGIEVLAQMKESPTLRMIPVLVLTTSVNENDVRTCYALHANSYLHKPLDLDDFTELMQLVNTFWLGRALPSPKPALKKTGL